MLQLDYDLCENTGTWLLKVQRDGMNLKDHTLYHQVLPLEKRIIFINKKSTVRKFINTTTLLMFNVSLNTRKMEAQETLENYLMSYLLVNATMQTHECN